MNPLQKALIVLACALLPRSRRLRYRAEFVAELRSLPRTERTAYAVAAIGNSPHLAAELRRAATRPLPCRVGLHHNRRTFNAEDMTIRSKTCLRCGRIKDKKEYEQRGGTEGMAYGAMYFSSGL